MKLRNQPAYWLRNGAGVLFFVLFQYPGVSLSILDTPGNPAQRGGGDIRLRHDLVVGHAVHQQLCSIASLCHVL